MWKRYLFKYKAAWIYIIIRILHIDFFGNDYKIICHCLFPKEFKGMGLVIRKIHIDIKNLNF